MVAAIVGREYLIARSYRFALTFGLLYGFLNLALYFYISKVIEGGRGVDLNGAPSYFAFAAVGVAIGVVFQVSTTSLALRIREEQLTGSLETLFAQPVTATEIALGLVGFPFLFAMGRVALYVLFAALVLGLDLARADPAGSLLVLLSTGLVMTGFGIAFGAVALVVKRATRLVSAVALASTFLGGAYFPLSVLPGWLEAVAKVLPLRLAFDGARAALFGGEHWEGDVLALLAFSAVALPISLWVFGRVLRFAQGRGSLAEY